MPKGEKSAKLSLPNEKGRDRVKKELWLLLGLYLLAVNLVAFLLMGIDKRKAKKDAWRIPEKTLFLPVLLGGSLGGILGMRTFRHKTKHWYFRLLIPLFAILQIALYAAVAVIGLDLL